MSFPNDHEQKMIQLLARAERAETKIEALEDQLAQGKAMYDAEVTETDALKLRLTVASTLEKQLVARAVELEEAAGEVVDLFHSTCCLYSEEVVLEKVSTLRKVLKDEDQ